MQVLLDRSDRVDIVCSEEGIHGIRHPADHEVAVEETEQPCKEEFRQSASFLKALDCLLIHRFVQAIGPAEFFEIERVHLYFLALRYLWWVAYLHPLEGVAFKR